MSTRRWTSPIITPLADNALFTYPEEISAVERGMQAYEEEKSFYTEEGVAEDVFKFGLTRNEFDYACANKEPNGAQSTKKPARNDIKVNTLADREREKYVGKGGSREKEWQAWLDSKAATALSPAESERIRQEKKDLIIPMRWVDTDKNEGKFDDSGKPLEMFAKSRLVVTGFRDKVLGCFRRDAPTASRLAEAVLLAIAAAESMTPALGDVKKAYFNSSELQREVYLEQPKGGLSGLMSGQLLKVEKAIYGFAEAARPLWLAMLESQNNFGSTCT